MTDENQELRKAGLKVTLPRLKILQILESSEGVQQHMSAEDVYLALRAAGEEVGLATVYRVLTQFESAGLVDRHNFEGVTPCLSWPRASITITWCAWAQAR